MKTISKCTLSIAVAVSTVFATTPVLDNSWNYEHDTGSSFSSHSNGFSYGWTHDKTSDLVDANHAMSPDDRYDSGIAMAAGDSWEIALEDGYYRVSVTAGNPTQSGSTQHILVEGQEVINSTPSAQWPWVGGVVEVQVADGRLTVTAGPNASGCVLAQIHIISKFSGTFDVPKKAVLPLKINAGGYAQGEYLSDKPLSTNADFGYVMDPLQVRAGFTNTAAVTNFDGNLAYETTRTSTGEDVPVKYQVRVEPDTSYQINMGFIKTHGSSDANKMRYSVVNHEGIVFGPVDIGASIPNNTIAEYEFTATSDSTGILHLEIQSVGTFFPVPPSVATIEVAERVSNPIDDGTISINFHKDNTAVVAPSLKLGVREVSGWNNLDWDTDRGKTITSLTKSDGSVTSVGINFSADNLGYPPGFNAAGSAQAALLKNAIGRNSATVSLSNLSASFPGGFDLYVYTWGGTNDGDVRNFSINVADTPTYYNAGADVTPNGTWTRSTAESSGAADVGNYVLWESIEGADSLTITGSKNGVGPYIAGIQIVPATSNATPEAVINTDVTTGFAPLGVAFDGSASSDTDGDNLTYAWDFGDGNSSTALAPSHTYTTPGTYTATLTVNDGMVDSAIQSVEITANLLGNTEPTANVLANVTSGVGPLTVAFDGSGSVDSDGHSLTYSWDFGDSASSSEVSPTHTYTSVGSFTAELTVSDGFGGTGSTSTTITVSNSPPTAVASSSVTSGTAPLLITFDGSGSTDLQGQTLSYSWNFGDGTSSTEESPNHTYSTAGTYTVTLTVDDGNGDADSDSIGVTVEELQLSNESAISINFGGVSLLAADVAGVERLQNWNNVNTNQLVSGLMDRDAVVTSTSVDLVASTIYDYPTEDANPTTGDQKMMASFRGFKDMNVVVAGLPASYVADGYSVIVYFGARNSGNYKVEYKIGTESRYIYDPNGVWLGEHRESTATTIESAVADDNYVRFDNLSSSGFTLALINRGEDRFGISGMQIVKHSTTSGPAYDQTYIDALFAGHGLGVTGPHTDFTAKGNGVLENGLIYAFGIDDLDPSVADGKLPVSNRVQYNGQDYFAIQFRRLQGGEW